MSRHSVIVCERTPRWAAAIRGHLPGGIQLIQTRTFNDCGSALAEAPRSLLAWELTRENLAELLDMLGGLARRYPRARAVVLSARGLEASEWLLREAGAVYFTSSPRDARHIAWLAGRHAERLPAPSVRLAARIWEELPWGAAAAPA